MWRYVQRIEPRRTRVHSIPRDDAPESNSALTHRALRFHLCDREQEIKKTGFQLGIALDGSKMSHKALEMGLSITKLAKLRKVQLLHVEDPKISAMAQSLEPVHIQHSAELVTDKWGVLTKWHCTQQNPNRHPHETLVALAHKAKVDLLLLGSYGHTKDEEVLGGLFYYALIHSRVSFMVVKSTSYISHITHGRKESFLLWFDGSRTSLRALAYCANYLVDPEDSLHLFNHSANEDPNDPFVEHRQLIESLPFKTTIHIRDNLAKSPVDHLISVANSNQIDILVLGFGIKAETGKDIMVEATTLRCKQTVLVIKDLADDREEEGSP